MCPMPKTKKASRTEALPEELQERSTKRILILTADAGFGHRSAAEALEKALKAEYGDRCEVTISNPLDHPRAPEFLRSSQSDYDQIVKNAPDLYRLGFTATNTPVTSAATDAVFMASLFEPLRLLIEEKQPDVIVSVYPYFQAPMAAVRNILKLRAPLLVVITDLVTVHRIWFNKWSSGVFVVPTDAVRAIARKSGIPEARIETIGIPVDPILTAPPEKKAEVRRRLGWEEDTITLLAVGSERVQNLSKMLHVLNHSALPLQFVVVAGGNDALYEEFKATEWHRPAHVYNFVDNLPEMMHAADFIMCKAGGLITTEALAAELAILVVEVIPGQETGNAKYIVDGGAGALIDDPVDLLETVFHWLDNDASQLKARVAAARKLGSPRAAVEIAQRIWRLADEGIPAPAKPENDPPFANLLETLRRSGLTSRSTE